QGRMKIIVSLISNRVLGTPRNSQNFPSVTQKHQKRQELYRSEKKNFVFDYWIVQICDTGRTEIFNALR
ncbi:14822_t:CDS:1, partial [Acaulospora morrowiae]